MWSMPQLHNHTDGALPGVSGLHYSKSPNLTATLAGTTTELFATYEPVVALWWRRDPAYITEANPAAPVITANYNEMPYGIWSIYHTPSTFEGSFGTDVITMAATGQDSNYFGPALSGWHFTATLAQIVAVITGFSWDTWNHYVWRGRSAGWQLYVNGQLIRTITITYNAQIATPIKIGYGNRPTVAGAEAPISYTLHNHRGTGCVDQLWIGYTKENNVNNTFNILDYYDRGYVDLGPQGTRGYQNKTLETPKFYKKFDYPFEGVQVLANDSAYTVNQQYNCSNY
jgi:hypothetical protein